MTHRAKILDDAKALICTDREAEYGPPKNNLADIAVGWSIILGHRVHPHQVALMMAWVKTCRTKTSPQKADSYVDGAGYFALAAECADAK